MHNFELSSSNSICQNPDVASNTENTLASGMSATISSIVFIGKCSRLTARFKSLGSKQMRILFGLTTVTILLTHAVGSICLSITPAFTILSSSSLILPFSATGTFLGGCTTGMTVGSILMVCLPGKHPSPWKRSGYSSRISGRASVITDESMTEFTRWTKLRSLHACALKTDSTSPSAM